MKTITAKIADFIATTPEVLAKAGFRQLKQMFPDTDKHDEVLRWAADNIKNNNLQALYLRHYRDKPIIHTTSMKDKLSHIGAMMERSPEMARVHIDKTDSLASVIGRYEDAEKAWQASEAGRDFLEPEGAKVADLGKGKAWYDIGRPSCNAEARAMGHCGNTADPDENDRILSLRQETKVGNKIKHKPLATFINNRGFLGEMKGRFNEAPAEDLHGDIAELLKQPFIKGIAGGGYMPEANFAFDHLSPELKSAVKEKNPDFVDINSEDFDTGAKKRAVDQMPQISKYEEAATGVMQQLAVHDRLNKDPTEIDELDSRDLSLAIKHPAFQRRHLNQLVNSITDIPGAGLFNNPDDPDADRPDEDNEEAMQAEEKHQQRILSAAAATPDLSKDQMRHLIHHTPHMALGWLKNHPQFDDKMVDFAVETSPTAASTHLKKRFNDRHIDMLMSDDPKTAAATFGQRLTPEHIDQVVREHPDTAAQLLAKRLTPEQVDKVVYQRRPDGQAPNFLNYALHDDFIKRLLPKHIDHIAEHHSGSLSKVASLLTPAHIDRVVQRDPKAAAHQLGGVLTDSHVNAILAQHPVTASSLANRMTPEQINDRVIVDPSNAFSYFGDRLTPKQLDHVMREAPKSAEIIGARHPLRQRLTPEHMEQIVQASPQTALDHFHDLLTPTQFNSAIERSPDGYIPTHVGYRLNSDQISTMIKRKHATAAYHFKDHFGPEHIEQILRDHPEGAAHLGEHMTAERLDKFVDQHPRNAAAYFHPHLSDDQVARIVISDPATAVNSLADRLRTNQKQIDHVMQHAPGASVAHWGGQLSPEQLDRAVATNPHQTIASIPHRLTPEHIRQIARGPAVSSLAYSRLRDRITPEDIDHIVQHHPHLVDGLRSSLTPKHVDYIVQHHPKVAANQLADALTPDHVDHMVKHHPEILANLPWNFALKGGTRITDKHISDTIEKAPHQIALSWLGALKPQHIDAMVDKGVVRTFANADSRHGFTQAHFDRLVKNAPADVAKHMAHRLEPHHIDHLVDAAPQAALTHLRRFMSRPQFERAQASVAAKSAVAKIAVFVAAHQEALAKIK